MRLGPPGQFVASVAFVAAASGVSSGAPTPCASVSSSGRNTLHDQLAERRHAELDGIADERRARRREYARAAAEVTDLSVPATAFIPRPQPIVTRRSAGASRRARSTAAVEPRAAEAHAQR